METSVSRRDLIRWAVSSLILAPTFGVPSAAAIARWSNATVAEQCDLLFGDHLPSCAKNVASQAAANLYAAVFEAEVRDEAGISVTRHWLCLGCETSPGQFAVQTSDSILAESTSLYPVEASVSVLDTGEVEVFQEGIRWNITERWRLQGNVWLLSGRKSAGVSGGVLHLEEYDQLRQELVTSHGCIEEDNLSTERQSISRIFSFNEYTRGTLA